MNLFVLVFISSPAFAASEKQLFSCLSSLASENIPGTANGMLIPLGTPTENSFLFEAKNTSPRLRDYIILEPDRIRFCKDDTRAGEAGFQLNLNQNRDKVRVEIKTKLETRDKGFLQVGGEYLRYTKCELVGDNSCYLDIQPQCREVSLINTPPTTRGLSRVASKKADDMSNRKVAQMLETLLKNLVSRRLSHLPPEKQSDFLTKNDLRDCQFHFINTHIAQFKQGAGLQTPADQVAEDTNSSALDIIQ